MLVIFGSKYSRRKRKKKRQNTARKGALKGKRQNQSVLKLATKYQPKRGCNLKGASIKDVRGQGGEGVSQKWTNSDKGRGVWPKWTSFLPPLTAGHIFHFEEVGVDLDFKTSLDSVIDFFLGLFCLILGY